MLDSRLDQHRLTRLIEVGRGLMAELDLDVVLDRVLETGRELTGARYAALGILDDDRRELAQFLTRGVDEETRRAIGDLPRGRGILGLLIDDPRPLRIADVGEHQQSYGFPPGHPPMHSFLGVPIVIRAEVWGNLYLTEKASGDFEQEDEDAVVVLADWAAIAIENARLYRSVDQRRAELERAVRGFEATAMIARAVGGETDLGRVLELIVKRGRALVEAHDVLILLIEGDELQIAAGAGRVSVRPGVRVPLAGSPMGELLAGRRAHRVTELERRIGVERSTLGVPDAEAALIVPLVYRGAAVGALVAFDRMVGDVGFTYEDEQLLEAFAASAATAVATAQSVQEERVRKAIEAAEGERRRWARELHDETLQGLAGLNVLLSSAGRLADPDAMRTAMRQAVAQVTEEIEKLRGLIAELRPAALDELGLAAALSSLIARTAATSGLDIEADLELDDDRRLPAELETSVYRLVQEALTNVVKHAGATAVSVAVREAGGAIDVRVADDGGGVKPPPPGRGRFGLIGMRERVELSGGRLEIGPRAGGGTVVRAQLPLAAPQDSP